MYSPVMKDFYGRILVTLYDYTFSELFSFKYDIIVIEISNIVFVTTNLELFT